MNDKKVEQWKKENKKRKKKDWKGKRVPFSFLYLGQNLKNGLAQHFFVFFLYGRLGGSLDFV